ncbi:hypothetical protein B484DRAFT_447401 [Ochromonadaceae sp. CCMP2298]|nr:hypothetical protein B484DRAFT_447401 [Ochromonadaceae sp. CCMP2298]
MSNDDGSVSVASGTYVFKLLLYLCIYLTSCLRTYAFKSPLYGSLMYLNLFYTYLNPLLLGNVFQRLNEQAIGAKSPPLQDPAFLAKKAAKVRTYVFNP